MAFIRCPKCSGQMFLEKNPYNHDRRSYYSCLQCGREYDTQPLPQAQLISGHHRGITQNGKLIVKI